MHIYICVYTYATICVYKCQNVDFASQSDDLSEFQWFCFLGTKKLETIVLSRKNKAFRLEFPFDDRKHL